MILPEIGHGRGGNRVCGTSGPENELKGRAWVSQPASGKPERGPFLLGIMRETYGHQALVRIMAALSTDKPRLMFAGEQTCTSAKANVGECRQCAVAFAVWPWHGAPDINAYRLFARKPKEIP
jgi:hypothetical protein